MSIDNPPPEFIEYLVKGGRKQVLTNFSYELKKFVESNGKGLRLKDVVGSLEAVVERFENAHGNKLKGLLAGCLTSPLAADKTVFLRKHEGLSTTLRNQGNEFYKKKLAQNALRCYTLAVMYAPPGSRTAALAFSNRSACFFELRDFERSLQDTINFTQIASSWAEESDQKIAQRVTERRQRCESELKSQPQQPPDPVAQFAEDLFKLKNPSESIPSAEHFIGIRETAEMGRHVVNIGKSEIPAGTLVILEPPYAKVLLGHFNFSLEHCTACLKHLDGAGVPCDNCVFALYCSPTCRASDSLTHTHECTLSPYLHELNLSRTVHLSLKTLLKLGPG